MTKKIEKQNTYGSHDRREYRQTDSLQRGANKIVVSIICALLGGVTMVSLLIFSASVQNAPGEPASGKILPILEIIGGVITAAKQLEGILLFLVLISILGIIAVVLHLWHKRTIISLTLISMLFLAIAVAAYITHKSGSKSPSQFAAQSRLFLPLGEEREVGPFKIKLTDVDTLKIRIKEGQDNKTPWEFNLEKFGKAALQDFVKLGRSRLEKDFIINAETMMRWPTAKELIAVADQDDPRAIWEKLVERLKNAVTNSTTEHNIKLKNAFSKWPLVHLEISEAQTDKILIARYFPDQSVYDFSDEKGIPYQIKIETIFNGDRDLGEGEACVLRLQKTQE